MDFQRDLFGAVLDRPRYPDVPGCKSHGDAAPTESEAATLRRACVEVLRGGDYTADEIAARLGRSFLSIRPRISELRKDKRVDKAGRTRTNKSGKSANVWRLLR